MEIGGHISEHVNSIWQSLKFSETMFLPFVYQITRKQQEFQREAEIVW